jgi:hypothetical protein
MKESNILKYSYAMEKLDTVIRLAASVVNDIDIGERLGSALSELHYPENEIKQDTVAFGLYNEIYSLIDYSKRDKEKGTHRLNVEEMPPDVRMHLFELIFKLYFRIEKVYYEGELQAENPAVRQWKESIKQTYEEFHKELEASRKKKDS